MTERFGRRSRLGITLVETMVVIIIAAVLFALLLVALGSSHEAARRNTCAVNQKNLALAVQMYVGSRRILPGYRETFTTVNGPVPVSWLAAIMPCIESNRYPDEWRNGSTVAPYFELMACPSDPQDQSRPSTSYVVNCGLPDKNPYDAEQIPLNWTGEPSTFAFNIPADWPANGAFVSRWEWGVDPKLLPRVAIKDFQDGAANTFLLSESLDASVWNDVVSTPMSSKNGYVKLAPRIWNTPEIPYGLVWTGEKQLKDNAGKVVSLVINGPTSEDGNAAEMSQCRPSSKHPGGVNMTYADGHVAFLNENIDYELFSLQMTPDGRNATPNGLPFIPTADLDAAQAPYSTWRTSGLGDN